MGVSVFPGRENLVPNVERVARDACSRLAQATRESINERLRDVLSRMVEELVLEGGLFFVPLESQDRKHRDRRPAGVRPGCC